VFPTGIFGILTYPQRKDVAETLSLATSHNAIDENLRQLDRHPLEESQAIVLK
jgi:hypothetical protein